MRVVASMLHSLTARITVHGRADVDCLSRVVASAKAQADEAAARLNALGAEGRASAVAGLGRQLKDVQTTLAGLGDKLSEIQSAVHAAKDSSDTGGSTGPSRSASPGARSTIPPFRSERAKADELTGHVEMRNHNGTPMTFGRLYDDAGEPLGPLHVAHADGPARPRAGDLKEPWKSSPKLLRHVEGHAAARMRKDKRRVAVLYITGTVRLPQRLRSELESVAPVGVHALCSSGLPQWWHEGLGVFRNR